MFERIAIVNRGEAAMRLIVAARELAGTRTIALYTEPDRRAMFVREADESHLIGPPGAYLDLDRLADALRRTRADAAWVGWGFVAENAAFADLCARLGVAFIGPSGEVMRRLGDKIRAKRLAEAAGVSVAPWSGGPVASVAEAREHAERLGYPLMIKASAGGGGRGIRRVTAERELADAFEAARAEAERAFGDPTVFLESQIVGARHVEVQIIADRHGTCWALGTRDCSIQRRNQKLVEEAPARLDPALAKLLTEASVRLALAAGYENAGTVEYLVQPRAGRAAFMEVNTRLQVEHPVTEVTTGVDLVKLQLHVAAGGRLEGAPPAARGHAIEVRLCAEDPDRGFAPAPGTFERFRVPGGPGIRVDSGYDRGDTVPAEFDSMIAKIIAGGETRGEALARMRRALTDTAVVLRGGASNKGFLLEVLRRPEVEDDTHDIGWLDRLVAAGEHLASRGADAALVQAAVEAYEAETAVERLQFARSAARGRPSVSASAGCAVELAHRGRSYRFMVRRLDRERYRVEIDGQRVEIGLETLAPSEFRLSTEGRRFRVVSLTVGTQHLIEIDGLPHRVLRENAGVVRAPAPAVVVSVVVKPGDLVAAGDRLVVLEAMKTYIDVVAEQAGRVREVLVLPNTQVGPGGPLVVVEPDDAAAEQPPTPRVRFDALVAPAAAGDWRRDLEELRGLVLGYDVDAAAVSAALRRPAPAERWELEDDVLDTFVDLLQLFRRRPAAAPVEEGDETRASAGEHFYAYLRDLSGRGEGVPAGFLERLRRALARYGVADLERTPALHESLYRICKARRRLDEQVAPILALLTRRIDAADTDAACAGDRSRELLDRLIGETYGRLQAVNDRAREARFVYFERALLDASRRRLFHEAGAHLAALSGSGSERRAHLEALVRSPHPLLRFLSVRLPSSDAALRRDITAVLLARHYCLALDDLHTIEATGGGVPLIAGEHAYEGKRIRVLAAHVELGRLDEALGSAARAVGAVPADRDIHLDVYTWQPEPLAAPEATARRLAGELGATRFPRRIRGVVVAVVAPEHVQHFTFRPDDDGGFVEQRHLRGLHPMVARRLELWRLARFELERLPSPDEVFLFRAVARDNRSDERLVALAEVRDLTPIRDRAGRVVGLPHLERVLGEALATMRFEQTRRPAKDRLHWNRVQLFLRPPLVLSAEELDGIVRRLAPATDGLGLERILVAAQIPDADGRLRERLLDLFNAAGDGVTMVQRDPSSEPMAPLGRYAQKVVRLRQQGLTYPYEIVAMLTPRGGPSAAGFPAGEFIEHDLAGDTLVPVDRPPGENAANVVVGVIRNFTPRHPEGMARVVILGDPSKEMGALAEPECRRIVAALALARTMGVPLEWFALSAGAKIAMDSGTENMDWIAVVLRRIIEYTQEGGEINVIVDGINVGAQPYWNAEATMLMHTRGILIMTEQGAMVLTGKRALDFSGGVSADDNFGIGGYERVMGPNGQAQYYAEDLTGACRILFAHYGHTYLVPGERFPRRAVTHDPVTRDILASPHARGHGFTSVGEVFSDARNAGRKKPFDIRSVLQAAIDRDHPPLERWFGQRGGEVAVVWDAHLGGWPVCLLGIESRPLPRLGLVPADGPEQYTPGTLFPIASKKIARAINAASGNRPVVVLANLTGFDGSPESMREVQLEYGAEIGRAVVNFRGPIVFCVVSRYHGGAFVVFSARLNDQMEVAALEGSYASVIGGAPAAAVVFAREVDRRTRRDPRIVVVEKELESATGAERARLKARYDEAWKSVYAETLGRVAEEFDRVHSVQRAQAVGSVHRIVAPGALRPYLIDAVERGLARGR